MSAVDIYTNTISFFATQLDRISLGTRYAISLFIRKLYSFLYIISYPFVRILFSFFAIILLTNMMYVGLKVMFSPVGLIKEEVYFDYLSVNGPAANLKLASIDQQWQYAVGAGGDDCSQSFFGPSTEYDISLAFSLAKSAKNWEVSQCMVYLSVLDCRGTLLASSARSLRLPYQSSAVLRLDSLLRLPLYLANLQHESETVHVDMMRGFRDIRSSSLPAHSLQVTLSKEGAEMDIEHAYISVEPHPTGLAYLFYSFPITSFFALNSFFVSIFLLSSCCLFVLFPSRHTLVSYVLLCFAANSSAVLLQMGSALRRSVAVDMRVPEEMVGNDESSVDDTSSDDNDNNHDDDDDDDDNDDNSGELGDGSSHSYASSGDQFVLPPLMQPQTIRRRVPPAGN